jgi:hypothetical protein
MELWHGTITEFTTEGMAGSLTAKMLAQFYSHHGYQPSESETRSWDNSLRALADVSTEIASKDVGVVLEYHLPYTGSRIDAIFFGKAANQVNSADIIELKQWSKVTLEDDFSLNVIVDGVEHPHPSQQALDYACHLTEIQSAFQDRNIAPYACSFCHNLSDRDVPPLKDPRFAGLLQVSPLFTENNRENFIHYFHDTIVFGKGIQLMNFFINGRFKPNKKLLEVLDRVLNSSENWHLLDKQRVAYNCIWSKVLKLKRQGKSAPRAAILIRGGPGTGKSVIATQILADAIRNNFTAVHSTGGKAFTTNLRARFKGADKLFAWNMSMRTAPVQGLDLLLVDEAHRIRYTSDTRWTPKSERNQRSQIQELLDAAKVSVFFLDENQYVRPDEIGCTDVIRVETKKMGIPLIEYDLDAQFRCGGCVEYVHWIDYLLGFSSDKPVNWKNNYKVTFTDDPKQLDQFILDSRQMGDSCRIVAGFCWKWSNPASDGTLIPDVRIGDWAKPWNAKALPHRIYTPENHPYTIWATTTIGESQVGCIYSAQGFEFDRVGVIWGPDLVWRDNKWIARKQYTFDSPVKSKEADADRLIRNAYRVLLTRGVKETRILCFDNETKFHIHEEIQAIK